MPRRTDRMCGRLGRFLVLRLLLLVLVALSVFVGIGFSDRVRAQETSNPPRQLNDLGSAFPYIDWAGKTQGVLLAIAPGSISDPLYGYPPVDTLSDDPTDGAVREPLFAPRAGYGLGAKFVARRFGRQLISLPTMTVFAPKTMVTLNPNPGPPNPFADMTLEDGMSRLLTTLSEAQWKSLCSPDGLGRDDLNVVQQPLFEGLLPSTIGLPQELRHFNHDERDLVLTDDDRKQVRLRLNLQSEMSLLDAKGKNPVSYLSHNDESLAFDIEPANPLAPHKMGVLYGQSLRKVSPNHVKPGDLDLKSPALNVGASLDGAATVGDLIRALRTSTGYDLYADGRLSRLPVAVKGGATPQVNARDLLEALCWATTATWRRIGPAHAEPKSDTYELTFDREGLGAQRGQIAEWAEEAAARQRQFFTKYDAALAARKVKQYLAFSPRDALNPTPEAQQFVATHAPGNYDLVALPVALLTEAQRDRMKSSLQVLQQYSSSIFAYEQTVEGREKARQEDEERRHDFSREQIGIAFHVQATFTISRLLQIHLRIPSLEDKPYSNPAKPDPPIESRRVVVTAAPRDRAEGEAIVQAAAKQGVGQLWIRIPDTEGTAVLAACIAAGKAHHLPVGAIVALMRPPAKSLSPRSVNVNLYGQTAPEWARRRESLFGTLNRINLFADGRFSADNFADPAVPEASQALTRRVEAIAAVPGLAGLALCDVLVPGYHDAKLPDYDLRFGSDFGYTVGNRLAFLRQEGYDPIDLDPTYYAADRSEEAMKLPFANTDGGDSEASYNMARSIAPILEKWQDFRAETQMRFLQTLRAALTAEQPHLPVFVTPKGPSDTATWDYCLYRLWLPTEPSPVRVFYDTYDAPTPTLFALQNAFHLEVFHPADFAQMQKNFPGDVQEPNEASWIRDELCHLLKPAILGKQTVPSYAAIDLTSYEAKDTIALLDDIFAPAPK